MLRREYGSSPRRRPRSVSTEIRRPPLLARIIHWPSLRFGASSVAFLLESGNLGVARGVRTLVEDERGTHDDDRVYAAESVWIPSAASGGCLGGRPDHLERRRSRATA